MRRRSEQHKNIILHAWCSGREQGLWPPVQHWNMEILHSERSGAKGWVSLSLASTLNICDDQQSKTIFHQWVPTTKTRVWKYNGIIQWYNKLHRYDVPFATICDRLYPILELAPYPGLQLLLGTTYRKDKFHQCVQSQILILLPASIFVQQLYPNEQEY